MRGFLTFDETFNVSANAPNFLSGVWSRTLLIFAFAILVFGFGAVHAQEPTVSSELLVNLGNLPPVRILPDNPFYFIKTLSEKAQVLLARTSAAKARLLLDFSERRLAESLASLKKNKIYISEKLLLLSQENLEEAQRKILKARSMGEETHRLVVKLQEASRYQEAVVEEVQNQLGAGSEIFSKGATSLGDYLVRIDQSLVVPEATSSGKIRPSEANKSLPVEESPPIFDSLRAWLRALFGPREVLRPLAR